MNASPTDDDNGESMALHLYVPSAQGRTIATALPRTASYDEKLAEWQANRPLAG